MTPSTLAQSARETLEKQAFDAVCPADHDDLVENIATASDESLHRIIADPCHIHKAQGYDCQGDDLGELVPATSMSEEERAAQREELIQESK